MSGDRLDKLVAQALAAVDASVDVALRRCIGLPGAPQTRAEMLEVLMGGGRFPHRWSGWPGAWCLDCGAEDANEVKLALGDEACEHPRDPLYGLCTVDHNGPCPEPGSGRHDPYMPSPGGAKAS